MSSTDQTGPAAGAPAEPGIAGTLLERMHIELGEVGPERVTASMPVAGNTQPYGLLHGGASAVLAETVGSIAATAYAGPGRFAVGIELNCSHHRSAVAGHVHAEATPTHCGRSLATYEIRITDDAGRLICTARLTCMLRDLRDRGSKAASAASTATR